MIAFCTHCWAEIDSGMDQCPHCGRYLGDDRRSYEEKLIGALAHPLPQARARICWLIGKNRIRAAVPCLMHLLEHDPDLFVRRAAVEGLGTLQDPRPISLLRALSQGTDRFLAAAAKKSLKRIGAPGNAG
jgi:HEAT repeat protein